MLKGIHMVTTEKNIQKNPTKEMVRELKLFIAKKKKKKNQHKNGNEEDNKKDVRNTSNK